jgi:hypothetical protein
MALPSPTPDRATSPLPSPYINVLWVLVLLVATGTLYAGFWAYRRARELNPGALAKPIPRWAAIALMIEGAIVLPLNVAAIPPAFEFAANVESAIALLVFYWVSFRVRGQLVARGVPVSWGFTLLFSVFYLQYAIDRHHRLRLLALHRHPA